MKVIGVTGTSGVGKTTVCEILNKKFNAFIIDADEVARELSKKGNMYLQEITEYFGQDILDSDGNLKRKELASLIYNDRVKREALNSITFKYVVEEIKRRLDLAKENEIIVIDAALLFESKLNEACDIVLGIIADEAQKIERICKRDNITKEMAKKRIAVQITDKELLKKADYAIKNKGDVDILEEDIIIWYNKISNKKIDLKIL